MLVQKTHVQILLRLQLVLWVGFGDGAGVSVEGEEEEDAEEWVLVGAEGEDLTRRSNIKIAISTDGGMVSAHFGRCPEFTIVEIEDGQLKQKEVIPNPGHHPGFLPQFLHDRGVICIIAGGMGFRAQGLFTEKGIKAITGVAGSVEEAIKSILAGTLKGGESFCKPGLGKGYGIEKTECDHPHEGGKENA